MTAPLGLAAFALLLAGAAPSVEAQRLGRLFTSAEERAHLDELRYQAQFVTPEPRPEPAAAVSAPDQAGPTVSSLTVNGIVRGSGGRGTVWVNGDQIERGGTTREGIQVNTTGPGGRSVRARLPSGVDTIEIKPGQRIDVTHGVVLEPYERDEQTPAGPSAFGIDAGATGVTPGTGSAAPAALPASGDAPAAGVTGAQRDAAVDDVLRRAMDAIPAPETLTPEGRAQAEDVRRQLERAAAGKAPAKP